RMFSSGPPPVSIELADEARQNVPAKWTLYRNGQKVGKLTTQMKYLDGEDAFQFVYHYSELKLDQGDVTLSATEAVSEVKMTRGGELREQSMTGKVKLSLRGAEIAEGTIAVRAVVANGVLTGCGELKSNWGDIAGELDPVPVPKNGQPLNPLQPVNRLGGVRGGQEWVVHESNPLQDAVAGLFRRKLAENGLRLPDQKEKESLVAKVGDAQQALHVKGADVSCWVIEYRRAEPVARTWVRASDGKVLRQEAFEKGESLTFERED
ncbi:MAG: hypothetical protein J0I06_14820, partial [Planctomycetes bacterium]|nr:hypothetical protein [Planctomycetota bacterium]